MAKRGPKTHHVVPSADGGWDVKRGGGQRATSHHNTKQQAIQAGGRSAAPRVRNCASTTSMAASPSPTATAMTHIRQRDRGAIMTYTFRSDQKDVSRLNSRFQTAAMVSRESRIEPAGLNEQEFSLRCGRSIHTLLHNNMAENKKQSLKLFARAADMWYSYINTPAKPIPFGVKLKWCGFFYALIAHAEPLAKREASA